VLPSDLHLLPSLPFRRKVGEEKSRPLLPVTDSFLQSVLRPAPGGNSLSGPRYGIGRNAIAVGDATAYKLAIYDVRDTRRYLIHRILQPNYRSPGEISDIRKVEQTELASGRGGAAVASEIHARLDTLDREVLPYFAPDGLHFDGAGRLWVIGEVGDSTFADVLADGAFLGRQVLPCNHPGRRVALQGRWLALDCQRVGKDFPFQLQLYAIE
jgi:hypothetical protein